ncbi:MAG TPA: asparagine synthase (glutamine-hydrolyzing), partial [Legionella sp.]|nr:asparagine synthase (glutamine-hydrolyzing) [Legionella sp.]
MCGIVGFFDPFFKTRVDIRETINTMASMIKYRGPDDSGVWADDARGIALGHRRLSILDLSPAGHQPMSSHSGRYQMVFNGEIYNHLVLRSKLEKLGVSVNWRGHSDTETLLESFSVWGISETLQQLVGMFAIALWDRDERRLTLMVDRLGEKPLFYGWVRGAFVFGSELKALRAYPGFDNPISRDALGAFLAHANVPAPYSIYQDVFKLESGCVLSVDEERLANRLVQAVPYWQLSDQARAGLHMPIANESEALIELEKILQESVMLQAKADVPLGAFLSGGVDSSIIAALMQKQSGRPIQTFTVGFDEVECDESPYARAVAKHLGADHHELRVRAADAQNVISLLPSMYDEPFADSSQIPTYLVCQAARRHVTVALSGDGGDELFGGYNRYLWGKKIWNQMDWMPPNFRRALGLSIQKIPVSAWDAAARFLPKTYQAANFGYKAHKLAYRLKTVTDLNDLYRSLVVEWPLAHQVVHEANHLPTRLQDKNLVLGMDSPEHCMMLWDAVTYLPNDILTKVDRAGMAVSLETRMPFLDHRVVEFAWRLPLHMKIRNHQGKWALRQVLYKYVPRELIERPKMGFGIPIGQWLRRDLRAWA